MSEGRNGMRMTSAAPGFDPRGQSVWSASVPSSAAKPRFTDFGDGPISDWHRTLGANLPAVNLDYVLVEYDRGQPRALVEYKHQRTKQLDRTHPTFQALRELCAPRAYELPFYVVRYADDCSWFRVLPFNIAAGVQVSMEPETKMSERGYTKFLENLRKKNLEAGK